MTRNRKHFVAFLTTTLACCGTAFVGATLIGAGARASAARAPVATAARTLNVHDEGRLRYVKSSGSLLYDEGSASGTLPGKVRVHFLYDGSPSVSAQFTIYAGGWSIRGHGSGRLNNPNSTSPSFAGSLTITGGSGRYAHAHGSGRLYGVFDRRNYALIVQALGRLRY